MGHLQLQQQAHSCSNGLYLESSSKYCCSWATQLSGTNIPIPIQINVSHWWPHTSSLLLLKLASMVSINCSAWKCLQCFKCNFLYNIFHYFAIYFRKGKYVSRLRHLQSHTVHKSGGGWLCWLSKEFCECSRAPVSRKPQYWSGHFRESRLVTISCTSYQYILYSASVEDQNNPCGPAESSQWGDQEPFVMVPE